MEDDLDGERAGDLFVTVLIHQQPQAILEICAISKVVPDGRAAEVRESAGSGVIFIGVDAAELIRHQQIFRKYENVILIVFQGPAFQLYGSVTEIMDLDELVRLLPGFSFIEDVGNDDVTRSGWGGGWRRSSVCGCWSWRPNTARGEDGCFLHLLEKLVTADIRR